jgi:hypothetical protein
MVAWLTDNADTRHEKLIPVPVGTNDEVTMLTGLPFMLKSERLRGRVPKDLLLFAAFNVKHNTRDRQPAMDAAHKIGGEDVYLPTERMSQEEFVYNTMRSKFILSPLGNGPACSRTWKALWLGAIPIVHRSVLSDLGIYHEIPILVLNDWKELEEGGRSFLEAKYDELAPLVEDLDVRQKLYADYWVRKMYAYKAHGQRLYDEDPSQFS